MPPLTDAEQIALERETAAFWSRCAAAGVPEHAQYSWRGMYQSDPARAEEELAAHRRSYVPPEPVSEYDAVRASYGITDASLAAAAERRRSVPSRIVP